MKTYNVMIEERSTYEFNVTADSEEMVLDLVYSQPDDYLIPEHVVDGETIDYKMTEVKS